MDRKHILSKEIKMEKIGFGPRFVAMIIDGIILYVVNIVIGLIFSMAGNDMITAIGSLVSLVISIGYYVYFWTTSGQTPGKMIMKIKVVATDGSKLTVTKAILRYIGYLVSAVVIFLGFIWVLFDADKQGWHDKIAGTYVVKA
jgi:uncharacterized RDD family membrane protein YckC